ncbi:WGR and DUF4132 domain-containing protein [Rugosimonospora acidiphila]|uniref:WGR and DUF4132 domain-containing protein n=1 Tax=Rugosimonospora acidiphila TaxID=556531 RepID=A0ABP9SD99_9ACTN
MAGGQTDNTAIEADGETFVFPAAWRRYVLPRRGGIPGPVLRPDAAGADELVRVAKATIETRVEHPASDPALVAAARAYLADPATGPAEGAGVVGGLVTCHLAWGKYDVLSRLADAWVATRGVVFAAQAAVYLAGLDYGGHSQNGHQTEPNLTRETGRGWGYFPQWLAVGARVRAYLAAAGDDEYAAAITTLTDLRSQSLEWRAATSFLLPTERSWVDVDCAAMAASGDRYVAHLLWCSATTGEQLALLAPAIDAWGLAGDLTALATVVEGAGPAVTPLLLDWFDSGYTDADRQQRIVDTIAQFPTDEAVTSLIARLGRKYVALAALEAARRFPRRALRLLAADGGRAAGDLLRVHVLTHQELAEGELDNLAPAARGRVTAVLAERLAVPEAPAEALPSVLVTPPWTVKRKADKPIVVAGLEFTGEPVLAWAPGERERWEAREVPPRANWWSLGMSVEAAADRYAAGELAPHLQVTLMLTGPVEVIRSLLPDWRPERTWDAEDWLPPMVVRYGLAALPAAVHLADKRPTNCTEFLLPFASARIASHMADVLARLKSMRATAVAWFDRHPAYAARALTPVALGKAGTARRRAEESLRVIAIRHRDEVLTAAADYGPRALAGVEALLGVDPLDMLPARIPELPAWAEPSLLPRILLRDRSSALGDQATRHLCTMLAISKPDGVYAGVPLVIEACDRRSLAAFSWALLQQWQTVGAPAKEAWPLHALRWLGDDDTVRQLSQVIRAWPGEGGHARAQLGLDVLADIGSDLALMHLSRIAQKSSFRALKERAGEKVAEVAAGLGLTAEQLADRLVPDLGLDVNGSLTLDYGPRRFVVGFDEQLKPYVADETGARRKVLPKPGARDDPRAAPAAYERFKGLKKEVRAIADEQIRRLEAAMVAQRRWSADDFNAYFLHHPLLWHIVRRLVWTATVGEHAAVAFRVAEDRTLADVEDDGYDLPVAATIGLAHPLHLGEQVAAWSETFADYEILQPFPQLGRAVHRLTDAEREATELTRFDGLKISTTTVLGLERRGWRRGDPQDGGVQCWMWRATPAGRAIVLDLDPGIAIGALDVFPDQRIKSIWINGSPFGTWRPPTLSRRFDELDAVTASEMLRDLMEVLAR